MQNLDFKIIYSDNGARAGEFNVNNKLVETPTFMPVATRGAIKGLTMDSLKQIDPDIILCNTYHLLLRPGQKIIKDLGGIHKYINWDKVVLTDSGGFQGWSLNAKQVNKGLMFKSIYDGSKFLLTPKLSIRAQSDFGSDIAMVLDVLIDPNSDEKHIKNSLNKTIEWAEISINNHSNTNQALFGIIQGGVDDRLREHSIENMSLFPFDGYAIGGLSVGETKEDRDRIVALCTDNLNKMKPRYVMGLGDISGMLDLIEVGVDMFDCVWPTRLARHGKVIDKLNYINLKNYRYKTDALPLTQDCECKTCLNFTRSYLRHLLMNEEVSAWPYLIIHNLYQTKNILDKAREAILLGGFKDYKESLKKI